MVDLYWRFQNRELIGKERPENHLGRSHLEAIVTPERERNIYQDLTRDLKEMRIENVFKDSPQRLEIRGKDQLQKECHQHYVEKQPVQLEV